MYKYYEYPSTARLNYEYKLLNKKEKAAFNFHVMLNKKHMDKVNSFDVGDEKSIKCKTPLIKGNYHYRVWNEMLHNKRKLTKSEKRKLYKECESDYKKGYFF